MSVGITKTCIKKDAYQVALVGCINAVNVIRTYLGDLTGLVVAAKDENAVRVADLKHSQ